MKRWYLVRVRSGAEKRIAKIIQEEAAARNLTDKIETIFIPHRIITVFTDKGKSQTSKKLFPGYVALYMELDDKVREMLNSIRGILYTRGRGREPYPLSDEEANRLLEFKKAEEERVVEVPFQKGDTLRIVDGPFVDFTGVVEEVYPEKGRVKLLVTILGRQTPVELSFHQVEPL